MSMISDTKKTSFIENRGTSSILYQSKQLRHEKEH